MISPAIIEQVRQTADVLEVVSDFVSLKKRGSNWIACCPFHQEKTPSFAVSPAKGIYKCFGCGKAGDPISFVMEIESLTYPEAIRFLAKKYHIDIPEEEEQTDEARQAQNERESLMIVLGFAARYYQETLKNHEEGRSIGLSYFRERGFTEATLEAFDLGYSLEAWSAFTDAALKKGYQLELLEKAGLTIRKDENKRYDRFRGRVIFPIHNVSGKVIAFGARILRTDPSKPGGAQPKYLNSPETEVYNKSKVLYGLYQAKQAIRQHDVCYLVEGYTDVISMHQAGVSNAVASSGTSLTEEQIRLISRYTQNITVLYDGDPAGIKASLRGIDMILEAGLNVRVVNFPNGDDPDSYLRRVGNAAFKEYLQKSTVDFITFKASLLAADTHDPFRKAEVIREMVESITRIHDPIKRSVLFRQVSNMLEVEEDALLAESNRIRLQQARKESDRAESQPEFTSAEGGLPESFLPTETREASTPHNTLQYEVESGERELLRLLMGWGNVLFEDGYPAGDHLLEMLADADFTHPVHQKIRQEYAELRNQTQVPDAAFYTQHSDGEIQKLAIHLLVRKEELSDGWWERFKIAIPSETEPKTLLHLMETSVLRYKTSVIRFMTHDVNEKILEAQKSGDVDTELQLMSMHIELKKVERALATSRGNVVIR
ncbi:DNA primase [Catalinimonas alkaloidigena]|uniref:DNA primase n=1 Tax=Catalinimonas alkaloidigena TaxID=1075417 RepID=A0A1G9EIT2_9BACT|nr:DNA primase [Catalinimonas alkaloidigena]SDK76046.1 DNA primase [Catalinimonas alkaloidigena]